MKLRTYKDFTWGFGTVDVPVHIGEGIVVTLRLAFNPRYSRNYGPRPMVFVPPGSSYGEDTLFFVMYIDDTYGNVKMGRFDVDVALADGFDVVAGPLKRSEIESYAEPTNEVYLEDYQAVDLIGPKGLDYSDMYIAKKLAYYLEETAP